ncbi:MAG: hypothetical protein AB7V62_10515 [Thermoleophilia bacterium]
MRTSPAATAAHTGAGSCRQCPVSCERVVQPAGCLESGCPRLYAHEREGRTWVGCLSGVFDVEIDLDGLHRLQRTKAGFGGLRAAREPLPICRSHVERTFEHREAPGCVNPDFLLSGTGSTYTVTSRRAEAPGD